LPDQDFESKWGTEWQKVSFLNLELVMRIPASLALMLLNLALIGQHSAKGNLVPNPGFEEYSHIPEDWFYTGNDFTQTMRYWESPTGASPDVYGPIYVPAIGVIRDSDRQARRTIDGWSHLWLSWWQATHCRYVQISSSTVGPGPAL
jgi:hypothetical protein